MNWLLVGSVGGGVTIVHVESGGMTYSAAQKLADEINAMYAAQQSVHADARKSAPKSRSKNKKGSVKPARG